MPTPYVPSPRLQLLLGRGRATAGQLAPDEPEVSPEGINGAPSIPIDVPVQEVSASDLAAIQGGANVVKTDLPQLSTSPANPDNQFAKEEALVKAPEFAAQYRPAPVALADTAIRAIAGAKPEPTPQDVEKYQTAQYEPIPARDFASELKSATGRGDREKLLLEMSRAASGIGHAISGTKQDDSFYNRMGQRAGRHEDQVQREMNFDALARKAQAEKIAKDPASQQNRLDQDLFIQNYPHLANKPAQIALIRKMTGDQLGKLLGSRTEYDKARQDLASAQNKDFLAAQDLLLKQGGQAADTALKEGALAEGVLGKLMPDVSRPSATSIGGGGFGGGTDSRRAAEAYHRYTKENANADKMITEMESIEAAAPGIFTSQDANMMRGVPEDKLQAAAGRLIEKFNSQTGPEARRNADVARIAQLRLEQIARNAEFGKALTGGEANLMKDIIGGQLGSTVGGRLVALQLAERAIRRYAQNKDAQFEGELAAISPKYYEYLRDNGKLLTGRSYLKGRDLNANVAGVGQKAPAGPKATAPNKPVVTPTAPATGGARTKTGESGKGTPADPRVITYSDGSTSSAIWDPAAKKWTKI